MPPEQILLLTPQRSYTLQYQEAFTPATWYRMEKATIGGLAGRIVSLFWPLISRDAYPFDESKEPRLLTYEVAQFFMSRVASPLIEQGYFADLRLTRPRLYSQLLDNLNKAAANVISLDEVGDYLKDAAGLAGAQDHRYEDIAQTIQDYRQFCIAHNLLDFSLYLELFWVLFKQASPVKEYLLDRHRHLIYDNCEEDIPAAHDFVRTLLPDLKSALILFDQNAGYRRFLGADPKSAYDLKKQVASLGGTILDQLKVKDLPASLKSLGDLLVQEVHEGVLDEVAIESGEPRFKVFSGRLHQDMVLKAIDQVVELVEDGVSPGDIAIISPFLSESLHYGLSVQLDKHEIRHHLHRPSRDLLDEPVTKVMLTFATLAHPQWKRPRPSHEAVTYMLNYLLDEADLVRAALLASGGYQMVSDQVGLKPFDELDVSLRDRITYTAGERYEALRTWLETYQAGETLPIDHFFSKAFGELLSQEGYGFHQDKEAGVDVGRLVESARKFRQAVSKVLVDVDEPVGSAYIEMVQQGVISAFYTLDWEEEDDVVLITPVHTFLLKNESYKHQIWLDVGSTSWHKRIHQPLTNPYVLSRQWTKGKRWADEDEQEFEKERLASLLLGLINRCTDTIYICFSELSAYGQEQTGTLREVMNSVMRYLAVSVEEGS